MLVPTAHIGCATVSDNTCGHLPSVPNYCVPQNAEELSGQAHLQQEGRQGVEGDDLELEGNAECRKRLHLHQMLSDLTLNTPV